MIPGKGVHGSRFRVHGKGRVLGPAGISVNCERSTVNQKGFTFIEIMIVLVIIGILLTLAQPSFTSSVQRAKEATLKENLFIMRDVIDQYFADFEEYPPTLEALVEERYLRKIPKDPITGTADTWQLVYVTNEEGAEGGIFDVYSGSDQVGLDGTPYTEW